jgi:17beta-estradiol 17-dehydrogenase / very-long-chain 3-oxoacyl-CoA reductase
VLRPAIQFVLYLLPERDLKKIYGDGWAIVTGATDGIGKALAFELAHRGFKVCLISRSAEKLKQVEKELVAKYKVSTATVQIDFARARESNFL